MKSYTEARRPRPIVLGLDARDARDYIARHPDLADAMAVSVADRWQSLKGKRAPVYATERAHLHRRYPEVYRDALAAGAGHTARWGDDLEYPTEGRIA